MLHTVESQASCTDERYLLFFKIKSLKYSGNISTFIFSSCIHSAFLCHIINRQNNSAIYPTDRECTRISHDRRALLCAHEYLSGRSHSSHGKSVYHTQLRTCLARSLTMCLTRDVCASRYTRCEALLTFK